jgi:hypothetical protein
MRSLPTVVLKNAISQNGFVTQAAKVLAEEGGNRKKRTSQDPPNP